MHRTQPRLSATPQVEITSIKATGTGCSTPDSYNVVRQIDPNTKQAYLQLDFKKYKIEGNKTKPASQLMDCKIDASHPRARRHAR